MAQGLRVLEQRYRCRLGELDLVCRDQRTLVIVEVRARSSRSSASAVESVDGKKRAKIINATRHLLMRHPQWAEDAVRFDVISIDGIDSTTPRLRWVKDAFQAT